MGFEELLMGINIVSIITRLMLAAIGGGIIGIDRGRNNRAAGLRTHMLVCIGACLTMLTNQYVVEVLNYEGDPTRMAAQVISGIGFLGAGTIIVTGNNRIKGLTTAAGLWASACMGLAIGIGFYQGAIVGFVFILGSVIILQRMDARCYRNRHVMDIYIELKGIKYLKYVVAYMRSNNQSIYSFEKFKDKAKDDPVIVLVVNIAFPKEQIDIQIIEDIGELEGVTYVEKLD